MRGSPGCGKHHRRLCRAQTSPMNSSRRGRARPSDAAASASPAASGYSVLCLPPFPWACAPTGSLGLKNNLIHLSLLVFALLGTSPDVPGVWCTQTSSTPTAFDEIIPGHHPLTGARWVTSKAHQAGVQRRQATEWRCHVRPLRTSQWWHSRPWRNIGRRARFKTGCPFRVYRFKSCRAHQHQLPCPARQIGKAACLRCR